MIVTSGNDVRSRHALRQGYFALTVEVMDSTTIIAILNCARIATRSWTAIPPSFDDEGRQIIPPRLLGYDTLVIAVGSVCNDFGTPGVDEHAIKLDTLDEAARFNRQLINACLRANAQYEPLSPGQLHCAIIGAGSTGVELAAEIHKTTRDVASYTR
jgi:NADH:ubiquinone reductase (H+-translocating)